MLRVCCVFGTVYAITTYVHSLPIGAVARSVHKNLAASAAERKGKHYTVFTDNVGADNTLIEAKALSGPMPTKWTFSGGTFLYDPSMGNLLVDILPAAPIAPGFSGYADAMNGTFGTDSSRMHDFGTMFESWGLVTEFKGSPPNNQEVPEPGALALLAGFLLVGGGVALRRRQ